MGVGDIKENVTAIKDPGLGINLVRGVTVLVITELSDFESKDPSLESYVSLDDPKARRGSFA